MSSKRPSHPSSTSEPPGLEHPDPRRPRPRADRPSPKAPTPDPHPRGVLIDVDGPLVIGRQAVPGAAEALHRLDELQVPFALVSNTTRVTGAQLVDELNDLGFRIRPEVVLSVVDVALEHLRRLHDGGRVLFLGHGTPLEGAGLRLVKDHADVVLTGGNGPQVGFEQVDAALRELLGGAHLIAMHRSLTWARPEGPALDIGPTVCGLEAASGVKATVLGKPAPEAFQAAAAHRGIALAGSVMVGDDLNNDVLAAQRLGMRGVLTLTGKTSPTQLAACDHRPDHVLGSLADLPALLPRLGLGADPSHDEPRSDR